MMKPLLTCFLFFFATLAKAQTPLTTTAASGSSSTVNGLYYAEIIGQSSVVAGTGNTANAVVFQGFKQPGLMALSVQSSGLKVNLNEVNPISYLVYPNPVANQLYIKLSVPSTTRSYVAIYSLLGVLAWSGYFPEGTQLISIPQVKTLITGKYVLHVVATGSPFSTILIKE